MSMVAGGPRGGAFQGAPLCRAVVWLAAAAFTMAPPAWAAPAVFWAGDPVRPGETVLVTGQGLGDNPKVAVINLGRSMPNGPSGKLAAWPGSGQPVAPVQAGETSLKFVLPASLQPGVFAYRITTAAGTTQGVLNRPAAWWAQGDRGTCASPGGWIRVFGKNLGVDAKSVPPRSASGTVFQSGGLRFLPRVLLQGPRTLSLTAEGDSYALRAALPKDLPPGEYRATVHNGFGGNAAWSEPLSIRVEKPAPWPARVLNVKELGADGTGTKDDTAALQAALAKAGESGGGVVFLPRGRYQVTETLNVPRFVVLRGERTDLVALFWPDSPKPPTALIQGTNSFGVEDLTLYASNHVHGIVADQGKPDAGDVFIRRVRLRADAYRGHLTPEQVNERFAASQRTMGGDSLRLGGRNVEVTGCDIYGSGRALYLSGIRGGRVSGNTFYNGRHGWYCISGSDGLVFEKNRIIGADLMSTGGGLNCLDGSTCSQNVYYAGNALSLMHGWDREAMTSDAGGGLYIGKIASAEGNQVTLAEDPNAGRRDWHGAAFYIHDGRGQGQYRRITAIEGRVVTLERSWVVPPDENSAVSITMLQRHYLVIGNTFSDSGISVQFYGISMEHIVAGNRCERAGGYQAIGKPYGGYQLPPDKNPCQQPSWYCQFLHNTVAEGSIYRSGANNAILSGDSVVGVFGWPLTRDWKWPYNRGAIVRGNRLESNAAIHVGGSENALPTVRDAVVENNTILNADRGVRVDGATAGVFLRGNRFGIVREPLMGTGAGRVGMPPAQRSEIETARVRALAAAAGLSEDPLGWPEVKRGLDRLGALPEASVEAPRIAGGILEAALARVAAKKPPLPLDMIAPFLGLRLEAVAGKSLGGVLQSGAGGSDTLALSLGAREGVPAWPAEVSVQAPAGWQVGAPARLPSLGAEKPVELVCTVPAGTWGRVELPVTLTLSLPKAPLRLHTRVAVGSSFLRDWMVLGPFPNKTGAPLDLTLYPPEDGVDLGAECDGAAGKIRWQPVRRPDNWLDLNALFSRKESGVAYAIACVEAEKETDAVLRLGSSGGVAVTLNGRYLSSASSSRSAAPDQDRTPVRLRAGDNVLLLKVSTATPQWRFTAELAPPPGGFAGSVRPVPAAAFAGRACFAPPPPRPAAAAGEEIRHTAGVNWRLAYSDNFDRPELSQHWRQAAGKWTPGGGMVRSSADRAFLAYAEALRPPVRIEYDTRVPGEQAGDLSAFWLGDPANYATGVLIGFGSNGNTTNKVLLDGAEVATSGTPLVQAGRWHHVIAQILADGQIQLIVDGQLSLNARVKLPADAKHAGLWTWGPQGVFAKVRVYTGAAE